MIFITSLILNYFNISQFSGNAWVGKNSHTNVSYILGGYTLFLPFNTHCPACDTISVYTSKHLHYLPRYTKQQTNVSILLTGTHSDTLPLVKETSLFLPHGSRFETRIDMSISPTQRKRGRKKNTERRSRF